MYLLQILFNSLVTGTHITLIALPLYIVYAASKTHHLALGDIGTFCAYVFYILVTNTHNIWLGVMGMIGATILMSFISFYLLEYYNNKRHYLLGMLVSFIAGLLLTAIISILWGTDGKTFSTLTIPAYQVMGLTIPLPAIMTLATGVIALLGLYTLLNHTPFGRKLKSLAENPYISQSLSISAKHIRIISYLIAITLAGMTTIFTGMYTALTPGMGLGTVILAFLALLMGGNAQIKGVIFASFLLALIPEFLIAFTSVNSSAKMLITFMIATVILLLRPKGIFYKQARTF